MTYPPATELVASPLADNAHQTMMKHKYATAALLVRSYCVNCLARRLQTRELDL